MNEMMTFEGNSVVIITENDKLLFEVYSTEMALGQAYVKILRDGEKLYPCCS